MTLKDFSLDNPGMVSVPEQYRLGSASLDFIGMGDMIAYDTNGLVNDGYYDLLQESLTDQKHLTRSWTVQEEVTAAFIQADINAEIGFPIDLMKPTLETLANMPEVFQYGATAGYAPLLNFLTDYYQLPVGPY